MITDLTMTADCDGATLAELQRAIDLRAEWLHETTAQSTVAATIYILRSLKKTTAQPVHGKSGGDTSFWAEIPDSSLRVVATGLYGGLYREKGSRISRPCARVGSHYGPRSHIRPVMWRKPSEQSVFNCMVYAVYSANPYDQYSMNVNSPAKCWYVLAESMAAAVEYGKRRIARLFNKESGMARYALGVAQAKVNDRGENPVSAASGNKQFKTAHNAAWLEVFDNAYAAGDFGIYFKDLLNYSEPAAGGPGAVNAAVNNAARAILHIVDNKCATDFSSHLLNPAFHRHPYTAAGKDVVYRFEKRKWNL